MRGFATHPIEFMPKLLLILRFYRSAMLFFCGAVSVALAWLVTGYGPSVVPVVPCGENGHLSGLSVCLDHTAL